MKILQTFQGMVIMTIHDLNLAAAYCSSLLVLRDGRIFMEGTPAEVLTREVLRDVFLADVPVHSSDGRILIGI